MIGMSSYAEVGKWLESKGIGCYLQGPDQMIVSEKNPAMPGSNCFWLTLRETDWYIGTWLPAAYHVPPAQDIQEVCESVFRSSTTAIYSISNDLVTRFNLHRLTDKQMEELGFT